VAMGNPSLTFTEPRRIVQRSRKSKKF